ncbi:catalase [Kitasatospora sp. NPDC057904]|uniref:catalase n=1 Tax=Kitasatospora sp. NPDC057904 TaxID=3346275 RepID=UPI0036DEE2A0
MAPSRAATRRAWCIRLWQNPHGPPCGPGAQPTPEEQPEEPERDGKESALGAARAPYPHGSLTTDQGVRVDDTDNSLAVGDRGPTLLEDFHLREKLTHFDHERIPERGPAHRRARPRLPSP